MEISKEVITHLLDNTKQVVAEAINAIYTYQKSNSYLSTYYNYPRNFFGTLVEDERFDEIKANVPALQSGIPFFITSSYDSPKKYSELLGVTDGNFKINCHNISGFNALLKLFIENERAKAMIASEEKYLESAVVHYVANIANRYLYITKKFTDGEIEDEILTDLVKKQLVRLFVESLNIIICVPICFLDFNLDEIELNESISICRMSDEFQIGRFNATHFDSTQEDNLVQCAAFMIRLKRYAVPNKERDSLHNVIKNYWSYPIEIIDDLFASIRIASGAKTGYGQLLIEPIDWADEWTTDLYTIYGTNIRAFNRKELDTKFFQYEIRKISEKEVELIKELFKIIREKRENIKHNKEFKRVFIAIERLNRCMLREADDDTALDAIIGIETLLSGDTHGEITYTIANRMSVVAARTESCLHSAKDVRKAMKIVYGLRSDIVHGREPDKNSKIIISEKEYQTKELAVDFLRYALLFILKNQQYLDTKQFEIAFDEAIEQ